MQYIGVYKAFPYAVRQGWRACSRSLAAAFVLALLLGAGQAMADTYTITMPSTDIAGVCTSVVAGASTCTSLRAAITAANATTTEDDTIAFSAGGTIAITSALLPINDTTTINGSGITLDGGGGAYTALTLNGAGAINSQLQGITITNFNGSAVSVSGAANVVVNGNTITNINQSAISVSNAANVVLNNNTITMPNDSFDAIRCFNSDNCSITGNNISNGFYGISVFNSAAIAGYNATVSGNIITSTNYGVALSSVSNVTVNSNTISATNFAGIRLVPQFNVSNTDNNLITNNSITGGAGAGIAFEGFGGMVGLSTLNNNLIQGNTITGNTGAGISFRSQAGVLAINANTITANTITGNGGDGVEIQGANAADNAIYANLNISGNGGLGIDLFPNGVTLNDAGDGDTGPNGLQNFPVITSIAGNAVSFTLDTTANASGYRIDFYNNPGGLDPTGYGEGQVWLGSCIVVSPSATTPSTCTIPGVSATTLRMTASRCLTAACNAPGQVGATSEFNTALVPQLTLQKTWESGSVQNHNVTVSLPAQTGTAGGSFVSNRDTATGGDAETDAGTPIVVSAGQTYTLNEVFNTGNAADYTKTLECTDTGTGGTTTATVTPTATGASASVTLGADATAAVCTFINTPATDIGITKDDDLINVTSGSTVSYQVVVENRGTVATAVFVQDPAVAGLTKLSVACDSNWFDPNVCVTPPTLAELEAGYLTPVLPAPPDSDYVLRVTARVTATSGTVTNTASARPQTGFNRGLECAFFDESVFDPATGTCTDSDTDNVSPPIPPSPLPSDRCALMWGVVPGNSAENGNMLVSIDPANGAVTAYPTPVADSEGIFNLSSLGIDPRTGRMFAVDNTTAQLRTLAPGATTWTDTGVTIPGGTGGYQYPKMVMDAFGNLYVAGQAGTPVYRYAVALDGSISGPVLVTITGLTQQTGGGDMAIAPDGSFYLFGQGGEQTSVYLIDAGVYTGTTATATLVGSPTTPGTFDMGGGAFVGNTYYWANVGGAAGESIYNGPVTGPYSVLNNVSVPTISDIATCAAGSPAQLTLQKTWASAQVNDAVTVTASNAGTLDAVANTADETDAGTALPVLRGATYTLSEAFTTGQATAYAKTLACTGNTGTGAALNYTADGLSGTITLGDTATNVVCTFTNTSSQADLAITKTNTPTAGADDQADDTLTQGADTTYTLAVTNNGPATVTGAVVRDAPGAGLTCPATNTVTCTSPAAGACPPGPLTVADLSTGVTLGTLSATAGSNTVTFTFSCTVN